MANQQDQNSNENQQQSNTESQHEQGSHNQAGKSGNARINDPIHNAGNEKMRIDEEGSEIQPDDEV